VYERVVDGNQDIYIAPGGGGPERRLTTDPATDALPRWSPDGRSVFFSSDRSGNWQIYEVAETGGEPRRVRTSLSRDWQADPSPDGARLAVLSNQDGAEGLWVWQRSGAAERLVRHGRATVFGNPDWSPDGRLILFSSNWRIGHQVYVVDVATRRERRLTDPGSGGCEPRFHPDGRRFVFVSRGGRAATARLVEVDLETRARKALVSWPALNYDPVYSPDGSELAFASDIGGDFQVYRQRLSDGKAWRVSFGRGTARNPDYRPR
jgi:Tol biopolymer transport system component